MPYLIVAIMALFGLGFVGLLFVAARRGRPYQHDAATATTTLRHGLWLRAFAVFAFFGAELVLCVWLLVNPPPTARLAALPLLGGVVLGLVGILLILEAYRFAVTVSPTGIECRSPWKPRRVVPWGDVESVAFSRANLWFLLKFSSGGSFRVSALVPGVGHFLHVCETHLPPAKMLAAKPGYAWVGRKWPYRISDR